MTNDGEQVTEKSLRMLLILRNYDEFSIIYEKYFAGLIWEISQTSENSIIGLFYPKI